MHAIEPSAGGPHRVDATEPFRVMRCMEAPLRLNRQGDTREQTEPHATGVAT